MAFVVSVEGSRGVGKTTLLESLRLAFPSAYVRASFEKGAEFDTRTKRGFIDCERWYISREVQMLSSLPSQTLALLARGPESIEFHCTRYADLMGLQWRAENELMQDLCNLRRHGSHRVLYLQASTDVLRRRLQLDPKTRNGLDEWFGKWHPAMEAFFLGLPHVTVIGTERSTRAEVQALAADWIAREYREWLQAQPTDER